MNVTKKSIGYKMGFYRQRSKVKSSCRCGFNRILLVVETRTKGTTTGYQCGDTLQKSEHRWWNHRRIWQPAKMAATLPRWLPPCQDGCHLAGGDLPTTADRHTHNTKIMRIHFIHQYRASVNGPLKICEALDNFYEAREAPVRYVMLVMQRVYPFH